MNTSRRSFISLGVLAGAAVSASAAATTPVASKPRLKLGVITDVHYATGYELGLNEQIFRRALEDFKANGVDAVMLCGDIINGWTVGEFRAMMETWIKVFGSPKAHAPGQVEMLYVTGNHEIYCFPEKIKDHPNWFCHPDNLNKLWREYFGEDYPAVFHRRVKGFSFVGAHWGNFKAEQVKPYIEEAAAATRPGDPIFYFSHVPQPHTCYGSDAKRDGDDGYNGSGTAFRAFAGHENVICLSGHTHKAGAHPRCIWQGDFTAIHPGVVTWCEFRDFAWPNDCFPEVQNCKDQMYLTVYDDRIVVERRNLVHGFEIGPNWTLPLPLAKATFPYTHEKMSARAGAPRFPEGARPIASLAMAQEALTQPWPPNGKANGGKKGGTLVSFPAAEPVGPEDLIRAYDVTAVGPDGKDILVKRVNTRFFFGPKGATAFYQCYFDDAELPRTGSYSFRVKAISCLGFETTIKG